VPSFHLLFAVTNAMHKICQLCFIALHNLLYFL